MLFSRVTNTWQEWPGSRGPYVSWPNLWFVSGVKHLYHKYTSTCVRKKKVPL